MNCKFYNLSRPEEIVLFMDNLVLYNCSFDLTQYSVYNQYVFKNTDITKTSGMFNCYIAYALVGTIDNTYTTYIDKMYVRFIGNIMLKNITFMQEICHGQYTGYDSYNQNGMYYYDFSQYTGVYSNIQILNPFNFASYCDFGILDFSRTDMYLDKTKLFGFMYEEDEEPVCACFDIPYHLTIQRYTKTKISSSFPVGYFTDQRNLALISTDNTNFDILRTHLKKLLIEYLPEAVFNLSDKLVLINDEFLNKDHYQDVVYRNTDTLSWKLFSNNGQSFIKENSLLKVLTPLLDFETKKIVTEVLNKKALPDSNNFLIQTVTII